MELLKQPQYEPYPLDHQVMLIFAGSRGYLDEIAVDDVTQWKEEFLHYMDTAQAEVGRTIRETYRVSEETEEQLKQAIEDFNASWQA